MPEERPDFTVYKSRRSPFRWLRDRFRLPERRPDKRKDDKPGKERHRRPPWRRLLKWGLVAIAGWLALSLVLFLVSAQISGSKLDGKSKDALSKSGNFLTNPNTILVLGSDKRKGEAGRGRSDTILLWRFDGGSSSKLSIPRDTRVTIPGFGQDKINAAFALGGPELTIKTIEFNFPPIKINHLMMINFDGFADLVDALGGVKMTLGKCIVSRFEGRTLRLKKGTHNLNGKDALGVVRTRKNRCAPSESDLTRARRQQQFLEAVKSKIKSPVTFFRLPWVAWEAPGAIESDMKGFSLISMFFEMLRASSSKPEVLPVKPSGIGTQLVVRDPEYRTAIKRFQETR